MTIVRITLAASMLTGALLGCERWMRVPEPPAPEAVVARPIAAASAKSPLLLHPIVTVQNGSPQNPSLEMERRVAGLLQDTSLFSHTILAGLAEPPVGGHIEARVLIDERIDPHTGQTAWRGFVIGASMFTLTPWIPLEYDYASRMTLELRRWDGQVKRYAASAEGTAFFHLFGATTLTAGELKGKVTAVCLADLRNQVVKDAGFFTATDTALLQRPSTATAAAIAPAAP